MSIHHFEVADGGRPNVNGAGLSLLGELLPFFPNLGVSTRVVIVGSDDRENERTEEEETDKSWEGVDRHLGDERAVREERALDKNGEVHREVYIDHSA